MKSIHKLILLYPCQLVQSCRQLMPPMDKVYVTHSFETNSPDPYSSSMERLYGILKDFNF